MSLRLQVLTMALIDAGIVSVCYWFAFVLRFGERLPRMDIEGLWVVVAAAALASVVLLEIYDAYRDLYRPVLDTLLAVLVATALAGLFTMAVPYATRFTAFPRSIFLIALPLQFLALSAARIPWIALHRRRMLRRRVVVVGAHGELLPKLVAEVREQIGTERVEPLVNPSVQMLAQDGPDLVVISPDLDMGKREEIRTWCLLNDVSCLVVPRLVDLVLSRSRVGRFGDFPFLEVRRPTLSPDHALVKRMTDLIGSLLLGLAAIPLLLLVAAAIKASDPRGPVLYKQVRVGLRGRTFTLYKFRTMVPDAEARTGPVLARDGDPRVTPVGRILRATRLDELPQLWNVLKGDMSLVGPRPERPEFVQEFVSKTPLYALRHNVRPGLTGLAQILGRYDSDYRDKLRYDLLYVAYASPLLDLKILLQTVRVVLFPARVPRLEQVLAGRWVPVRGE